MKIKKINIDHIKEAEKLIKTLELDLKQINKKNGFSFNLTSIEKSLIVAGFVRGTTYGMMLMDEFYSPMLNQLKKNNKISIKSKFVYKPSKMKKYEISDGEQLTTKIAHMSNKDLINMIKKLKIDIEKLKVKKK